MHLKPLRPHLEEMEECDYLELEQRIPALFHVICLIWANSQHYRQPARIIILLQEISNLMIELVSWLCVCVCVCAMIFMDTSNCPTSHKQNTQCIPRA